MSSLFKEDLCYVCVCLGLITCLQSRWDVLEE